MPEARDQVDAETAEALSHGPLLIGFDGSEGGKDALELARVLRSMSGSRCLVATVLSRVPRPAPIGRAGAAELEALREEAQGAFGGLPVEVLALEGGSAARMLIECAEAEKAEVIVVGSPHRGLVGRALIGSVAKDILYGAPCQVAVAPSGYAAAQHEPFRRIAVAFDGTPEAKAALKRAEELALPGNALIEIFTVLTPPVVVPSAGAYGAPQPSDPDKVLNEAIHSVDTNLGAHGRRLEGAPATALAKACEDGIDLLVAGSRGYGPVTRVLLGSVTKQLAHESPCPILIVPRP